MRTEAAVRMSLWVLGIVLFAAFDSYGQVTISQSVQNDTSPPLRDLVAAAAALKKLGHDRTLLAELAAQAKQSAAMYTRDNMINGWILFPCRAARMNCSGCISRRFRRRLTGHLMTATGNRSGVSLRSVRG